MGVLDNFLLGRGSDRRALNDSILKDYLNAQVLSVTEKGILVERPDTRASTLGAATALQRTTGRIPEGFFTGVSERAPNSLGSSIIAFKAENAEATFKKLSEAGIKRGSSVSDLQRTLNGGNESSSGQDAIAGAQNKQLRELLASLFGNTGKKRQPFGSTTSNRSGSAASSADGFSSVNDVFRDGFQASGPNLPTNNNDVSSLGNFLDNLSIEGFNGFLR